ncbi:substrate-binding domain-containing protein [Agaribacter marinus]|uniref:Substrate-binding domain-containing protein n=1 Tax=Virgibacillus salarius TaxID=447199 RepID=A0A941DTA0_9BACI|nr:MULTISPECIES: substrate-binding domain-containing protein [Virgibacillus]MBR7794982.1 substrate-binding domain-containing protein [Virgibacillus salarius]MDY7046081.1 substrate-binding domain-containing protein [Virgibacillus sp. M23]NAZ07702.1 substrate-binding domain-containing protein [Agaribacter marinus]
MKKITIADVAAHANVSKSTVSQFLNKRYDYMGEETKKRIETAVTELGYRPNIIARSLKQKSTKTIGVIVANILHVFSTQVIRAIEDFCHESNFHVIVCNADDDPVKEKRYIEMLRAKQVDGIIAFPTGENMELYQGLLDERYPFVFMDRLVPGIHMDAVLLDNKRASELAVDQFVKAGYKKIGMISPLIDMPVTPRLERIQGYKTALAKYNLSFQPEYLASGAFTDMQMIIQQMLSLSDPPEALLALNDRVLFEILQYAKDHHVNIPNDLAIIGIDDVSFASFYYPTLTTISQPAFKMGKKAAQLLFKQINQEDQGTAAQVYRFPPQLIDRESC